MNTYILSTLVALIVLSIVAALTAVAFIAVHHKRCQRGQFQCLVNIIDGAI